jgi:hypothetical protein
MQAIKTISLLDKVTTTGAGPVYEGPWNENRRARVQAAVDGDGAVTATVNIEGSNDGQHWELIGALSLSGTTTDSDSLGVDYPWSYVRADLDAVTGTDAVVSALMSF